MRASFGGVDFTDEVAVLVWGQHEAAGFYRFVGGAADLPLAARAQPSKIAKIKECPSRSAYCYHRCWRDIEQYRHDHPGEGICRLLLRQSRLQ
jgi:hypothetical protein